jgi:K+-sensing histidine kinase KdpD
MGVAPFSCVGLGFAICRSIARAHADEIVASNRMAGRAEFCITLPCAAEIPEVTLDKFLPSADV